MNNRRMKMKKLLTVLFAVMMVVSLAACSNKKPEEPVVEPTPTEPEVTVMSHAEYAAAEIGTECTIEAYVQDHQSWWNDAIKLYLQDKDGAYFAYDVNCTKEDADKLVTGVKVRVTGVKTDYKGEIELYQDDLGNRPTLEIIEDGDTFVAEPADVTALVGTDELYGHVNEYVLFSNVTVKEVLYNWDGSGAHGDDVDMYCTVVTESGAELSVTVPRYLRGLDSEVYTTVESLVEGDVIDACGFLYWYDTANPHITAVVKK